RPASAASPAADPRPRRRSAFKRKSSPFEPPMQILKRLSLTARIISLMCLVAFGFVCLFVWFLLAQRAALYAEKRQALRQVVELAHVIVEAQVRTASGPGATAASI